MIKIALSKFIDMNIGIFPAQSKKIREFIFFESVLGINCIYIFDVFQVIRQIIINGAAIVNCHICI